MPIPRRQKKPVLEKWPQLRLNDEDLPKHFSSDTNIGILTGEPSNGLIDVDLDCDEAVLLASTFLPETPMWSGRDARPESHAWFRARESIPDNATLKDMDNKTVLVELRGGGRQTVVAPSLHPSGDQYRWHGPLEPGELRGPDLVPAVRRLAAAVLLARHWPKGPGSRHDIANALAGMLIRAGWSEPDTMVFIASVARAAGDDEVSDRKAAARATAKTLGRGGRATGVPTLGQLLGEAVVQRAREWLGLTDLSAYTAFTAYGNPGSPPWPDPLDKAALHGLAGEFVRVVDPQTEADPAAILFQLLVAVGNCIGRAPFFEVEADHHHMNLFAVIVGETSKARKGTSWGQVQRTLRSADGLWAGDRIVSGLSSGEGLIWAVRDEIVRQEPVKKAGRVIGYEEVVVDPGVDDKRLLVVESEFASALRVLSRDGNTLSATIRASWDTGTLRTLTKSSPARATGAHISVLGHITKDELVRHLESTEAANGFANRILWICARRSKALPDGGRRDEVGLRRIDAELGKAVAWAHKVGQIRRDSAAAELWHAIYGDLSEGRPGLFGAVISRAEAQVTRLSCLYALLDRSSQIRVEHLQAALAAWKYAEQSAMYIFQDTLGDPVADAILRALRSTPSGLTRDEIRNLFDRNQSASRISRALGSLLQQRLARFQPEETGGRPAERWFATKGYAVNAVNAERGSGGGPATRNEPADPPADGSPDPGGNEDEVLV